MLSGCSFEDTSSTVDATLDEVIVTTESNTTAETNTTTIIDTTSPTFTSASTINVDENTLFVLSVVTDENTTLSLGGDDLALFDFVDSNLSFKVAPDYEVDKHTYALSITATDESNNTTTQTLEILLNDVSEITLISIPTLVIVMNWTDYNETNPSIWSDKFFNNSVNSVNRYYNEMTNGEIEFTPITESSGISNDGIIIVDMNKSHPGDYNATSFRDTEIVNAITSSEVNSSVDFSVFDTDNDGDINNKELQIIFIVAGGETSYGDDINSSIWAHAWSFDSVSAPVVNGVKVMRYTGDLNTSGSYARFGANHGNHTATIGIIAHELGHSALNLEDYYDYDGGGSGLGSYDLMSGGSWASQVSDTYDGDTPTQLSAYNKIDANLDIYKTDVNASTDITIKCSSRESIKLLTSVVDEYFLVECRDTAKANSDIAFNKDDTTFTQDGLFTLVYHVDDNKTDNTQSGVQDASNHYKVLIVEKDTNTLLSATENLTSDFNDVYVVGDSISTATLMSYDALTSYSLEVLSEDTTFRTMKIRIIR